MRPSKHVTRAMPPAQEVFDISITRLLTPENVPAVTTSEVDAITLFAWSIAESSWLEARIEHAPVSVVNNGVSISNTWNWSRRVGLTSLDELIYVAYKRASPVIEDQPPELPMLMLNIYRLDPTGRLDQVSSFPVPMPRYQSSRFPYNFLPEDPGFELWAGMDHERRKLLIVTQTYREGKDPAGEFPELTLMEGDVERLGDADAWQYHQLGNGGFGLDVRHHGDELVLAFRTQAAAITLRHPRVEGLFREMQKEIHTGADFDEYFVPVQILRVTLSDHTITSSELPGGEHPRIQSVEPLVVTMDRPKLLIDFREDTRGTLITWDLQSVVKLIFLFDDEQPGRIFRGGLMSFSTGDSLTLPRTAWPWLEAQDLYTDHESDPFGWTSIWRRFLVEPLAVRRDTKDLFFDFLNKTPKFALMRSRAQFSLNFDENRLTLIDLKSEVFDINHVQIRDPDQIKPDSWGENRHFGLFDSERATVESIIPPRYTSDNTIGGSLVNDRDGVPYQFVSYTDLGDGGLRVIFDETLPPPDEPTPPKDPKNDLDPDAVPRPGSGDEDWFVLAAPDWTDAQVPEIDLGSLGSPLVSNPFTPISSITSSVHCQIESLILAGLQHLDPPLSGLDLKTDGWSPDDVNKIQTKLNTLDQNAGAFFSGTTPQVFISVSPQQVVAAAESVWSAGIVASPGGTVAWTFSSSDGTSLNETGSPLQLTLPTEGDWTVSVVITPPNGPSASFSAVVPVARSLFDTATAFYGDVAKLGGALPGGIGNFQVGAVTLKLLQYEITFPVETDPLDPEKLKPARIIINTLDNTDAQWRFINNGGKQGLIDYRERITFETEDIRLDGVVGLALKINRIKATFFYGRRFTPAILMNDTRGVSPVDGRSIPRDSLIGENGERRSSTITARPHSDAAVDVTRDMIEVDLSLFGLASIAAIVTVLLGLGLTVLLAILTPALALLALASANPIAGGTALAVAAFAVFFIIHVLIAPAVARRIGDEILSNITSADFEEGLESSRLLQFSGEGIGESIARQIIPLAIAAGANQDPVPTSAEFIGRDRFRQDLFQMVHVCEGQCRVLVRI